MAHEHSTNWPIGNSRKLVLLRGLMVNCSQEQLLFLNSLV